MKTGKQLVTGSLLLLAIAIWSCKKSNSGGQETPPPVIDYGGSTWQENWFDHNQLLQKVYGDTSLIVYYDNDVSRSITWPNTFVKDVWQYSRRTYGYNFGPEKTLYAIFHAGRYGGGHPGYYYSSRHGGRNVIDCGSPNTNAWVTGAGNDLDLVTHEVGHIVESAANGTKGSPAFAIWKDSKWMEIYIYDVYLGLGRTADAQRWFNLMQGQVDNFPQAGTQWFKNWFYPIYNQYGGSAVLNKFFKLVATYFPKNSDGFFTRDMNWGEFVHFWSGAAGVNLKQTATNAFGWPAQWETEFTTARTVFSAITY